jgi:DNA-binding LytR/AlgR family response regulator
MKLRVAICEDEELSRKRAARLTESSTLVGSVVTCDSVEALRPLLADVDVVLLDIHLPGESGVAFAREHGIRTRPLIIFLTAFERYAVEAFDVGAVDYVLKPVVESRLHASLARAHERLAARVDPPCQPLALSTARGVVMISAEEVSHCVLAAELVTITMKGTGAPVTHVTDLSLSELASRLPNMMRVHRRALLALEQVTRFEDNAAGGYVAVMRNGDRVEVSRQVARQLRRELRPA